MHLLGSTVSPADTSDGLPAIEFMCKAINTAGVTARIFHQGEYPENFPRNIITGGSIPPSGNIPRLLAKIFRQWIFSGF